MGCVVLHRHTQLNLYGVTLTGGYTMYNPTNPRYSTQNQTRFTPNYEPTVSDNPYASSPYDLQNIPTPPKPPHVKNKVVFASGVVIVVLLVVMSGLVFGLIYVSNKLVVNVPTRVPTVVATTSRLLSPTQAPTKQTQNSGRYAAKDIIKGFCNTGQNDVCDSGRVSYGGSLWEFSSYTLQTDVNPTSSVQFVDFSRCHTSCAYSELQSVWIGVYASVDDMIRVFGEVSDQSDHAVQNGTINQINGSRDGELPMMQSGRCLMVGDDALTTYGKLVAQYCV
jgi:hypothetical protein